MKKLSSLVLIISLFLTLIASTNSFAQDLSAERNCFTWSFTLTNASAVQTNSMTPFINATVTGWRPARIDLAPSETRDFSFVDEYLGQLTLRAFDASGIGGGGADVTNELFTTNPCGDAEVPVYCFVWIATYAHPGGATASGVTARVEATVADWVSGAIMLQPNEIQEIRLEGQFVGSFIQVSYDASLGGLTIDNIDFAYERCDITPRLNTDNAAAPTALYLLPDGDNILYVYAVDPTTSTGIFAFSITPFEISLLSTQAVNTGTNLLIIENMNIALYALSSGECQVNGYFPDSTLYEYIFDCPTFSQIPE